MTASVIKAFLNASGNEREKANDGRWGRMATIATECEARLKM